MDRSLAVLLADASERFLGDALGRLDAAGYGGMSVSHAFAVQLIDGGVVTITALADVMRMTPQAVSAIINQLDDRGLVARSRSAGDARTWILSLTGDGRRLATEISVALRDAEHAWTDLVGAGRMADVKGALAAYVGDGPPAAASPARRRTRRVRLV
jgi:DNA-binding MarR family transcriptional regulator